MKRSGSVQQRRSDGGTPAPPKHPKPLLLAEDGCFRQGDRRHPWGPGRQRSTSATPSSNRASPRSSRDGNWTTVGESAATKPGEFNTLHSIADAQGRTHVGDRFNRRIQVFAGGEGNFPCAPSRSTPPDPKTRPVINMVNPEARAVTFGAGRAVGGVITPSPNQGSLRLRRLPLAHFQAHARRQACQNLTVSAGRQSRAVRVDPSRDCLPFRSRTLGGRKLLFGRGSS